MDGDIHGEPDLIAIELFHIIFRNFLTITVNLSVIRILQLILRRPAIITEIKHTAVK